MNFIGKYNKTPEDIDVLRRVDLPVLTTRSVLFWCIFQCSVLEVENVYTQT